MGRSGPEWDKMSPRTIRLDDSVSPPCRRCVSSPWPCSPHVAYFDGSPLLELMPRASTDPDSGTECVGGRESSPERYLGIRRRRRRS